MLSEDNLASAVLLVVSGQLLSEDKLASVSILIFHILQVIVRGSPAATQTLAEYYRLQLSGSKVFTPGVNEVIDATLESHIYQVMDLLFEIYCFADIPFHLDQCFLNRTEDFCQRSKEYFKTYVCGIYLAQMACHSIKLRERKHGNKLTIQIVVFQMSRHSKVHVKCRQTMD